MNSILAKPLLINKATETAQPALAQQVTDAMDNTFDILDQRHSNCVDNNGTDFHLLLVHKTDTMDI